MFAKCIILSAKMMFATKELAASDNWDGPVGCHIQDNEFHFGTIYRRGGAPGINSTTQEHAGRPEGSPSSPQELPYRNTKPVCAVTTTHDKKIIAEKLSKEGEFSEQGIGSGRISKAYWKLNKPDDKGVDPAQPPPSPSGDSASTVVFQNSSSSNSLDNVGTTAAGAAHKEEEDLHPHTYTPTTSESGCSMTVICISSLIGALVLLSIIAVMAYSWQREANAELKLKAMAKEMGYDPAKDFGSSISDHSAAARRNKHTPGSYEVSRSEISSRSSASTASPAKHTHATGSYDVSKASSSTTSAALAAAGAASTAASNSTGGTRTTGAKNYSMIGGGASKMGTTSVNSPATTMSVEPSFIAKPLEDEEQHGAAASGVVDTTRMSKNPAEVEESDDLNAGAISSVPIQILPLPPRPEGDMSFSSANNKPRSMRQLSRASGSETRVVIIEGKNSNKTSSSGEVFVPPPPVPSKMKGTSRTSGRRSSDEKSSRDHILHQETGEGQEFLDSASSTKKQQVDSRDDLLQQVEEESGIGTEA
ncbi:unnamed protein product [Amoebophrya sp. A120]|nr:unnamed protein product [Amoebophrya sp. A120]|eukprot:GSA120T00014236001.1